MPRTKLNNCLTAAEAIEAAGLNWGVEQSEIMTTTCKEIPGWKALYRSDNDFILGVVGAKYQPIQNHEAFSFFDTIMQENGGRYVEARSLKGGRNISLTADFGEFEARPGDTCRRQLVLSNGHDGFTALRGSVQAWRLVCSNGLMGWKKETSFYLKHTSQVQDRLGQALNLFKMSQGAFAKFEDGCRQLAAKIIDREMVSRFLDDLFGKPATTRANNKRAEISKLIYAGQGNEGRTAWDLLNGVTEYVDHQHGSDDEKRLVYATIGDGANLKAQAFEKALSL